jgi:hypothetical protein
MRDVTVHGCRRKGAKSSVVHIRRDCHLNSGAFFCFEAEFCYEQRPCMLNSRWRSECMGARDPVAILQSVNSHSRVYRVDCTKNIHNAFVNNSN